MTCTVTGIVLLPDGTSAAKARIVFSPYPDRVRRVGANLEVPGSVGATLGDDGLLSVGLNPGAYTAEVTAYASNRITRFALTVPDAPSADFAQCLNLPLPTDLNAAEQAVEDAQTAMVAANASALSASESAADAVAARDASVSSSQTSAAAAVSATSSAGTAVAAKETAETARDQVLDALETVGTLAELSDIAGQAESAAAQAAIYNQGPILDSVAALAADAQLSYAPGAGKVVVAPDDIVRTRDGHAYIIRAAGSADYDWATAGGVRLYLLPSDAGHYNFSGMNPAANGTTDDYPKLARLLARPGTGSGYYQSSPPIYFPNGRYFMGQTIQLKRSTRLFGNASGMAWDAAAELIFPADTAGIIVHRYNTIGWTTEASPTTAGDASRIEGIALSGGLGSDLTKHGIWLRARAVVRNVRISNFAGAGFRPYAASNGTASFIGNCNNWVLQDARISGCEWGVFVEGYDANAGHCYNVDCSGNRRWGFYDASFLGCTFTACHADANGREQAGSVNVRSAYASFAGVWYHAVPGATEQQLVDTQPGTNAATWRTCIQTSYAVPWTGGQAVGTYRHGGGYHSDNLNARASFISCYNEGGQGLIWLSQHSIMMGGLVTETPVASGAHFEGRFGVTWSRNPFGTSRTRLSDGRKVSAQVGGDANSLSAFEWADSINNQTYRWQPSGTDGTFEVTRQGGSLGIGIRGPSASQLPNYFQLAGLALGIGGTLRAFGRVNWSTASGVVFPTSGTFAKGDICLAPNPDAGGKIGFVCTTGGVAGSTAVFKAFGAIDA